MANGIWDITNQKDRNLFSRVLDERIEKFGLQISYWRVDRDDTKDSLYNEDTKPLISAKYDMKVFGNTFEETSILSRFGLENTEEIEVQLSKNYFEEVLGADEVPYEGDFVYVSYNSRMFQIADVKDSEIVFLENEFGYKLLLKPADISGEEVTENIGVDDYESALSEIDDSDLIETLDDDIVVTKTGDSSPYGDWE